MSDKEIEEIKPDRFKITILNLPRKIQRSGFLEKIKEKEK